jgi:hypothetical protein
LYPHVRLGVRSSVCRDFAVLGYCEKGIDCEEAHIRECPDFAETGSCKNPKCKLPHVIRANRKNLSTTTKHTKVPNNVEAATASGTAAATALNNADGVTTNQNTDPPQLPINGVDFTFEGGDEYIPLTFVESEEEEEEEDTQTSEEEEDEGDEDEVEVKVFA